MSFGLCAAMTEGENAQVCILKICHYSKVCKMFRSGELGFLDSKAAGDSGICLPEQTILDISLVVASPEATQICWQQQQLKRVLRR